MQNKSKEYIDLHIHTTCSDGILSPEDVVKKAIELNLKAISITDHDCIDGVEPSLSAAKGSNLEVIPGIELSAVKDETEIHILGYFIDWKNSILVEKLNKMQNNRMKRMKDMIALVCEKVAYIDEDKVFKLSKTGTIGRLHLARYLMSEGIVRNVKEAFDKYLGDGKSCTVKHKKLDYVDAINLIKKSGGVAILAHPGTMGKDEYIEDYVKSGLSGIEVFHTKHKNSLKNKYSIMAEKYELLVTGGSDCHGMEGKHGLLMGKVDLKYDTVNLLRKESEKIRNINE